MKINVCVKFFTCVVLLVMSSAFGQQQPAAMDALDLSDFPSPSSAEDLTFRIFTSQRLQEPIYIRQNDAYCRLQPMVGSLSRAHFYSGTSPMLFYRKELDEQGKMVFLPLGECPLPAGSRDVIISLRREGGQLLAEPIDLSLRAQPLGSVRFINLTPAGLFVLLDDERSLVQPGAEIMGEFETGKTTFFNFKIGVQYQEKARMIFSNRYPFRGAMRMVFIGYADGQSDGGDVGFKVIYHTDRGPVPVPYVAAE